MNKLVLGIVVVAVIAILLGTSAFVSAQSPTPQPATPGNGYGMQGGRGMHGGMMNGTADLEAMHGLMHDDMTAVFSQMLGISVEDLNARLAKGETMAQIATAKGLTAAQFQTLMTDARSQAIDQAVKEGTLTQAQADWMKQRGAGQAMGGQMGGRMGGQMMGGGRGMRGTGQGQSGNTDCPFNQTTP